MLGSGLTGFALAEIYSGYIRGGLAKMTVPILVLVLGHAITICATSLYFIDQKNTMSYISTLFWFCGLSIGFPLAFLFLLLFYGVKKKLITVRYLAVCTTASFLLFSLFFWLATDSKLILAICLIATVIQGLGFLSLPRLGWKEILERNGIEW